MKDLSRQSRGLRLLRRRSFPTTQLSSADRHGNSSTAEATAESLRTVDPHVDRGTALTFWFDEDELVAYEGETIAAAALAQGVRTLRLNRNGEPRGVYCGIGVCFDCLVSVDGSPNQRACITAVRPNMRVTKQ